MKIRYLILFAFSVVFFASCTKEESNEAQPESTATPVSDQIRKVIRYDSNGAVKDSVLFQYDALKRVTKIEYGNVINGQFKNKVEYTYSVNTQRPGNIVTESNSILNAAGQYVLDFSTAYSVNSNNSHASSVNIIRLGNNYKSYGCIYDSAGFTKSILSSNSIKMGDFYLEYFSKSQNNNVLEVISQGDPFGGSQYSYEYYPEPYNHNLYLSNYESGGSPAFWNAGLQNLFDVRNSFLGNRNQNLIKRVYENHYNLTLDVTYQYDFNANGLVTRIKSSTISSSGITTPMATKYELFYY